MKAVQTRMAQLNQEKEKVEGTLEEKEVEFQALKEHTTKKDRKAAVGSFTKTGGNCWPQEESSSCEK